MGESAEGKRYFDMTMEEIQALPEEERRELAREDAAKRLEDATKGVIRLSRKMKSRGGEVSELHYDFSVLTNKDFIGCMDADRGNRSMGTISRAQALRLYYKMNDKVERPISGLDYHDLDEQAGIPDTEAMIEKASDFCTWSKLVAMTNR